VTTPPRERGGFLEQPPLQRNDPSPEGERLLSLGGVASTPDTTTVAVHPEILGQGSSPPSGSCRCLPRPVGGHYLGCPTGVSDETTRYASTGQDLDLSPAPQALPGWSVHSTTNFTCARPVRAEHDAKVRHHLPPIPPLPEVSGLPEELLKGPNDEHDHVHVPP
jgi:hypothetical protein